MKGDFTRSTFHPEKHYNGVRMQQGRVQLDADWNEQVDITNYHDETSLADLIGLCGTPAGNPGFTISAGAGLQIGSGHFYVDGILVENDANNLDITRQPDAPNYVLPTTAGHYQVYLDVFNRHITSLEDPGIHEVALGTPDTATRTRYAWQVRLAPIALPAGQSPCDLPLPGRVTGQMRARTDPGSLAKDTCDVPAGGGYRRLENQLYRVEIHEIRNGKARFKWSRDNGSVVTAWLGQNGADLTVNGIGPDRNLGFSGGQMVELTDDAHELMGIPGTLVHLANAEGQILTVVASEASLVHKNAFPGQINGVDNHPKVRRWDSVDSIEVSANWIPLEDGIEVAFQGSTFQVGDYWLIPARTNTGDVEWPKQGNTPQFLDPDGVHHHSCCLAIVRRENNGSYTLIQDCRPLFPPLTQLLALTLLGGDGQEAPLGAVMARPLRVGVAIGQFLINSVQSGYKVRFVASHNGQLATVPQGTTILTNPLSGSPSQIDRPIVSGEANAAWQPSNNPDHPTQYVTAILIDSGGQPVNGVLPLTFAGNLSIASQVTYQPGQCTQLNDIVTVQDALDRLCNIRENKDECCIMVGVNGEYVSLDDAFNLLPERIKAENLHNICLCLLPGEHKISAQELNFSREQAVHLSIRSMSRAGIILEGGLRITGLLSLGMSNLDFTTVGNAPGANVHISLFEIGQVLIENCTFHTLSSDTMLGFATEGSVTLRGNRFECFQPLTDTGIGGAFAGTLLADVFREQAPELRLSRVNNISANLTNSNLVDLRKNSRTEISQKINAYMEANTDLLSAQEKNALANLSGVLAQNKEDNFAAIVTDAVSAVLNQWTPGNALFFSGAETPLTLEDNFVYGTVYLYGPLDKLVLLDPDLEKALVRITENGQISGLQEYPPANQVMRIRGCTLTKITLADWMARPFFDALIRKGEDGDRFSRYYGEIFCESTIFAGPNNILFGENINLHSCVFKSTDRHLGWFAADGGIYVGNRAQGDRGLLNIGHHGFENVANLRLFFRPF